MWSLRVQRRLRPEVIAPLSGASGLEKDGICSFVIVRSLVQPGYLFTVVKWMDTELSQTL